MEAAERRGGAWTSGNPAGARPPACAVGDARASTGRPSYAGCPPSPTTSRWSSSSLRRATARRPPWASGHGRLGARWPGLTSARSTQDRQRLVHDLALALLPDRATRGRSRAAGRVARATSRPRSAAARLASAAAAAGVPVTIVLDELHLLTHRAALDLVLAVAVRLPPGSRIVAIADRRAAPADRAAAQRGAMPRHRPGRAGVLPGGDRRPSLAADVRRPPRRRGGRRAARGAPRAGPRGCTWRCSSCPRREEPGADVRGIARQPAGYIADYFRDDVLAWLSVDTVRFLMRTAVLDRFCAPLCDAVLRSSGPPPGSTRWPPSGSSSSR